MKLTFNPRQLELSIQNIAEIAGKSGARELRKVAIKIRDLARDYAPTKTGTLEDAINYIDIPGPQRRKVFVVYIDEDMAVPGDKDGKVVGEYVDAMENELMPYGRGRYKLGPGSEFKAAGGSKVGGKFLSRAVKDGTKGMMKNVNDAIRRSLSGARAVNMDYRRTDFGDDE